MEDTRSKMRPADSFLYGMIGSAVVEALRIYKIATLHPALFHWPYFLISIAFIFAGGMFTAVWAEDQPIKAFYIGATFPIWLSALATA
jgi:hypothetical protein